MAKKFSCDLCLKRFKNEAALADHKKSDRHMVMVERMKQIYEEVGKAYESDAKRIRAA